MSRLLEDLFGLQPSSPLTKPSKQSVNLLEDREAEGLETKPLSSVAGTGLNGSAEPSAGRRRLVPDISTNRPSSGDVIGRSHRSYTDDVTGEGRSARRVNTAIKQASLDDMSWLDALAPPSAPPSVPVEPGAGEELPLRRMSVGNGDTTGNDVTAEGQFVAGEQVQKETASTISQHELLLQVLETLKSLNKDGMTSIKDMVRARLDVECASRRATENRLRDELHQLRREWRSQYTANTTVCNEQSSDANTEVNNLTSDWAIGCDQLIERVAGCLPISQSPRSTSEMVESDQLDNVLRDCHSWLASFSDRLTSVRNSLNSTLQLERSRFSDEIIKLTDKINELQLLVKQMEEKNLSLTTQLSDCCSCRDTALERVEILENQLTEVSSRMNVRETEYKSERESLVRQTESLQANIEKCRRQLLSDQSSWLQLVRQERAAVVAEAVRVSTRSRLAGLQGDRVPSGPLIPQIRDDSHSPTMAEVRGMYQALLEEHQVLKQRSKTIDERQKQLEEDIASNEDAKRNLATIRDNVAKQQRACSLKSREADDLVKTATAIREEGERAVEQARQLQLKLTRQQLQLEHREAQLQLRQELVTQERIQLSEERFNRVTDNSALPRNGHEAEGSFWRVSATEEDRFLQQESNFLAGLSNASKLPC